MFKIYAFIYLVIFLHSNYVLADVMPQGHIILKEKLKKEPSYYNKADQFCLGKEIGEFCLIDGTPFEGGGLGKCERRLDYKRTEAVIECIVDNPPKIDRGFSFNRYQHFGSMCNNSMVVVDEILGERIIKNPYCEPVPVAVDKFCTDFKEGDTCVVEFISDGKKQLANGRCASEKEIIKSGYMEWKERSLLLCQPLKKIAREYKESTPPSLKPWYKFW